MTEDQLIKLRFSNRIQVRDRLIFDLITLLRKSTPQPEPSLQRIAENMRLSIEAMKFPQFDSAISTMAQAEYEEAIEELLRAYGL